MHAYELDDLRKQRIAVDDLYLEFLRVPALSVGLYSLPADGVDPQLPHTEDEVYYVVKGRGRIRVGDEDRPVQAGSVVYVAANVEHRFYEIVEDLDIIVFFAPAEYSARQSQPGAEAGA